MNGFWAYLEELLWPYYARYPSRLLDSYVCSHGCLDQLAQFLAFQLWRDPRHLTLEADKDQLRHETRKIVDRCERDDSSKDKSRHRILKKRIKWIGRFLHSSAGDITKSTALGWKALVSILVVGLIVTAVTVRESWLYHPIYVSRMEAKEKEIKEKAEKWRKKKEASKANQNKG